MRSVVLLSYIMSLNQTFESSLNICSRTIARFIMFKVIEDFQGLPNQCKIFVGHILQVR
jgi:hypothetical protein